MYSLYVILSLKIRPFTQVYKFEELPAVPATISSSRVKGIAGIKLVPRLFFNVEYLQYSELADLITVLVLLISTSSCCSHLLVDVM